MLSGRWRTVGGTELDSAVHGLHEKPSHNRRDQGMAGDVEHFSANALSRKGTLFCYRLGVRHIGM